MKKILIKLFGIEFLRYIRGIYLYIKKLPKFIFKKKIIVNEEIVEKYEIYSLKNKNTFFGYFDLNAINGDKLLAHSLKKYANSNKDIIDIGYFDLNTKKFTKLCSSKAWSWQQGTRLRWSKKDSDVILFNDIENNNYCTKIYNIKQKKVIDIIPFALYDIDEERNFGISINFSRLQRLRPGYGYSVLEDKTINDFYPKDDGIFLVDIKNKTSKLIVSLENLSKDVENYEAYEHYINHISISPSGKRVMFFHLYNYDSYPGWKTRLYTIDIDTLKLNLLDKDNIVSHYDWIDDDSLIITGIDMQTNQMFYRLYKVNDNSIVNIENPLLKQDGHPSYNEKEDIFISDTYPDINCKQHLFKFDIKQNKYEKILDIFSNPRLRDEKRCDLHPRVDFKKQLISIDSNFKKYKRSIVVIKTK